MEKPHRHLVRSVFWSGIGSNGPKMPIFDQKCQFWPSLDLFGPKIQFFGGEGVKLLVPSYQETDETPFRVENIDRWGSNWSLRASMCFYDPTIWIFGAKSQFFVWWSRFLSIGHITSIPGATTFPFGPPPKKFRFRAMGHFSGLTPVFGGFGLVSGHRYKYP